MKESDKGKFFTMKKGVPHHVKKVGGKFGFNSLPNYMQETIKNRLAEKDEVMARGLKGELPGLKIDGRQVTRENLHEFEIAEMSKPKKEVKKVEKKVKSKYVKEDLMKLSFLQLKKIAEKFGETGRSNAGLIKDILKHN